MPQQVLPDEDDFAFLKKELEKLGFREITGVEFYNQFKRLKLKAPRRRLGKEVGFMFYANGLTVFVWTTWLRKEKRARKEDAAWVLITEGGEAPYFSHPIHRTKNFIRNLLCQAWIARWRILHRPLCPECSQFMQIVRGKGVKSRYWSCLNIGEHESKRPVRLSWDHGLPPKAKKYVDDLRKKRAAFRAKQRKAGKPAPQKIFERKPWKKSKTG